MDRLAELVALGRSKDGGRLVQDQQLAVAVESLEDLDPLLLTNGQSPDHLIGINIQLILLAELQQPLLSGLKVQSLFIIFNTENYILDNRKRIHQFKVLVHHANTVFNGFQRGSDMYFLAIQKDFACGRLIQTVKDVHQRRLACAVLSEKAQDFAFFAIDAHVIVGKNTGKFHGYILHLQGVIGIVQRNTSLSDIKECP